MAQAVLLVTSLKVQSEFLGANQLASSAFSSPSYSLKPLWSVPRLFWALTGLVLVSRGPTKNKASNPHPVCLWSHEWIKANPFAFSEKQLKAHVFLMVPLSFLCDQQTSPIEHSLRTLLGDRKMERSSRQWRALASETKQQNIIP